MTDTSYGPDPFAKQHPAAYPPPQPAPGGSANVGGGIAVLGLGLALVGLFALPMEDFGRLGRVFGVDDYRQLATTVSDRGADVIFHGYAQLWWNVGVLLVLALLIVAVAATALRPRPATGWTAAGIAVVFGVLHAVAIGQTTSYEAAMEFFQRNGPSAYDHAGIGIWFGMAGLAVVAVGGVVAALRRPAAARPVAPAPVA